MSTNLYPNLPLAAKRVLFAYLVEASVQSGETGEEFAAERLERIVGTAPGRIVGGSEAATVSWVLSRLAGVWLDEFGPAQGES